MLSLSPSSSGAPYGLKADTTGSSPDLSILSVTKDRVLLEVLFYSVDLIIY